MPNSNPMASRQAAILRRAADILNEKDLGEYYFADRQGNPLPPVHDHDRPDPDYDRCLPDTATNAASVCVIGAIAAAATTAGDWPAAFAKKSIASLRPAIAETLETLAPGALLHSAGASLDAGRLGITTLSDELLATTPQSIAKARAQRLLRLAAQAIDPTADRQNAV